MTAAPLAAPARAKVNLHLHVTGRRDDGYHLLDSLVVFAGAADQLELAPADTISLSLSGPFASGLAAFDIEDNLVLRAARALAAQAGITAGASIALEKNLPLASGIGGGSADAAAALRLLQTHWSLDDPLPEGLAVRIGADIPVCLAGRPVVMQGIGEVLLPAPRLPPLDILLVNPLVAVSTADVFRMARAAGFTPPASLPPAWATAREAAADLARLSNDLETPAIRLVPVIGDIIASLARQPGCLLARMSGSGATCFGLFEPGATASRAHAALERPGWWLWSGAVHM
jgi:4-diphosphocytidyl-2-C-methyl-D-erythritol kinase